MTGSEEGSGYYGYHGYYGYYGYHSNHGNQGYQAMVTMHRSINPSSGLFLVIQQIGLSLS